MTPAQNHETEMKLLHRILQDLESTSNCNPMKYHIPDCISNLAIFDLLKTANPTWKF